MDPRAEPGAKLPSPDQSFVVALVKTGTINFSADSRSVGSP